MTAKRALTPDEVPENVNTSWNNNRYMNHHETNQGTTATNQQFNNSRYVFTSLAHGLRWPGRAPGSPGPLLLKNESQSETLQKEPCDSKGYTPAA